MSAFAARQITDQQIGAIRWHQGRGVASEIYVTPRMRRQGVATALWKTARNLHTMATGGRRLQISGRRTVLGDLLARRVCDPPPPLDELVLPMTPRSETSGAEQRQLAPDDVEEAVRHYSYLGVPAKVLRAYCAPTAEQAWVQRSRARRG
ncbi:MULTISPECIES: GNAT family N-acetyltransferase [unclassified Nocardiopsis]|uniref:GNAT family N-acetyltransferase n=1 Tax=unclassified Nocardiopsis TaxID=2649073 RepID=UPI001F321B9B|nr:MULTISPECIES: GNAT family N-acetyltransferase [unclassified Nocardiopsis]